MRLLESAQLQNIEQHLSRTAQALLAPAGDSLGRLMQLYVMQPGKRVRPQLTVWTYLHGSRLPASVITPTHVLDVAAAWELFHAFLLVHDDIIDGADRRRTEPALHRQLQLLDSNSPRFGLNLGIVAGDLFYAAVNRLLADLDVPADVYRSILQLFARVAQLTGGGQAIDIQQSHVALDECDEQTLLLEYVWKTAAYTFEGPMLSGAILCGLDAAAREPISAFALALGQAYQLQNDLHDLARPVTEGADMAEGKRTVTLLRARSLMTHAEREAFDADLARVQAAEGRALNVAESLRLRVLASGAFEATQQTIDALITTAATAGQSAAMPTELSHALGGLLDQLRARYFVTAA